MKNDYHLISIHTIVLLSMRYSKLINDKASRVMGIVISVIMPCNKTLMCLFSKTIKSKNLSYNNGVVYLRMKPAIVIHRITKEKQLKNEF